jgi:ribosomal protein L36
VVGDFRDGRGFYRNFVSTTIDAFEECGARLYNEAILLQATGTAAMRATKQFTASRKLVKLHQNVLVFCNGDPRTAARKGGA